MEDQYLADGGNLESHPTYGSQTTLEDRICEFWHEFRLRLNGAAYSYPYNPVAETAESFYRLPIEDFADAFFKVTPSLEKLSQIYHDVYIALKSSELDSKSLHRIRAQGCIADMLWSLALTLFRQFTPHTTQENTRRPSGLIVERLSILEEYAVTHIFQCMEQFQVNGMLLESYIYYFVQFPTRLFVILELAYIFEVCNYFRETARSVSPILVASRSMMRPFTRHPLLAKLSQDDYLPTLAGSKFFETFASFFLRSLFYPIQDIVKKAVVHSTVTLTLIERCLVLYLFTRVPVGASLRTYLPEMIPILLTVFSNEDKFTVNMAHRLLFFIFKSFHRDFDAAENYLQLATYVYTQTLHNCTIQLKHWNLVIPIKRSSSSDMGDESQEISHDEDCWNERGNQALQFLYFPEGTCVSPGRSSLSVIIEIPLMIMLLMRLQVSAVASHAPIILERLLQFLAFTEPHKNCLRLQELLHSGEVPCEPLMILDFKTQRDLLDAQVKTIAFISFFLRGPLDSTTQASAVSMSGSFLDPSTASKSFNEIGSIIMEYLEIVPYQVGCTSLANCVCVVDPKNSRSVRLIRTPQHTFFNQNYDRVRSIYCRREILVSLRSILRSFEFRFLLPCGLSDFLQCWLHLGTGLEAADYLRPFICQLRIELLSFLRTSTMLQHVLLADASSMRQCRSECQQILGRCQSETFFTASSLSPDQRLKRLKHCFRWDGRGSADIGELVSRTVTNVKANEAVVVDCSRVSATSSSSSDPQWESIGYGDLRALLLSRACDTDLERSSMLPPHKFLPLSTLSQLAQELCCDLHDPNISLYTQIHIANSLAILLEWVDRFSLMDFRKHPTTNNLGCLNQFMDHKEASNIHRRILESCSSKLWSLQYDIRQQTETFDQWSVTEHTVSPGSQCVSCTTWHNSNGPDLFSCPRQVSWVNSPLHYQKKAKAPFNNTSPVESLKEIRLITKALSHVVRTASFLLTVVGVSGGELLQSQGKAASGNSGSSTTSCLETKEKNQMSRLQQSAPLADADYQITRDAFFYVLNIATLYGKAMSRALCSPSLSSCVTDTPRFGCWNTVLQSVAMSPATPGWPTPGATFPNAEGHLPSVQTECLTFIIQQTERELYDAAVSILTTFHPVIAHRFFICELPYLVDLVEQEPGMLVVFELLLQHSQISLTLRRLLVKHLIPLLPTLADPVFYHSVRIPEYLGQVISDKQHRETPCQLDHASIQVAGHLIHLNAEQAEASHVLAHFESSRDLPDDMFRIPYEHVCPTRQMPDLNLDSSIFSRVSLHLNAQETGFHYHNSQDDEILRDLTPAYPDSFLDFCFPPHIFFLPESLVSVPKTLVYPPCLHQVAIPSRLPFSSNVLPVIENSRLFSNLTDQHRNISLQHSCATATGHTSSKKTFLDSHHSDKLTYRYMPCLDNSKDHTSSCIYLNSRKQWLLNTRTVLVSRRCPTSTQPNLMLHDWLPPYCAGLDEFLITSELWYPMTSCDSKTHTFTSIPLTKILGAEGLFPGVETLTHTSVGYTRLSFVNLSIYLWKMCLTMGSRADDSEIWCMIEKSLPLCLTLCCHAQKYDALLFLIHYFSRFSMMSWTVQHSSSSHSSTAASPVTEADAQPATVFSSPWFFSAASSLSCIKSNDQLFKDTLAYICLICPINSFVMSSLIPYVVPHLLHALSCKNSEIVGAALRMLNTMAETLPPDTLWECFKSSTQQDYDPKSSPPLFSRLVSLMNSHHDSFNATRYYFGEPQLIEVRDPVTGYITFQENTCDVEVVASQNALCFFASRILGKLSRLSRSLLFASPFLASEPQLNEAIRYPAFLYKRSSGTCSAQFLDVTRALHAACATLRIEIDGPRHSKLFHKFSEESRRTLCRQADFQQDQIMDLTHPIHSRFTSKVYPITTYPHQYASSCLTRYWSSHFTSWQQKNEEAARSCETVTERIECANHMYRSASVGSSTKLKMSIQQASSDFDHHDVTNRINLKRRCIRFLKSVMLSMFHVQKNVQQSTTIWPSSDQIPPLNAFASCSTFLFESFFSLIQGLLYGTVNEDEDIKKVARTTLNSTFNRVGELLPSCSQSCARNQHPMILIRCLVLCLDLTHWAVTAQSLAILKSTFEMATTVAVKQKISCWFDAKREQCWFLLPLLERCTTGTSASKRGAAAYVFSSLLEHLPFSWIVQHFEQFAASLLAVVDMPSPSFYDNKSWIDPSQFLAASLSGDALLRLISCLFSNTNFTWSNLCSSLGEQPCRSFCKFFLVFFIKRFIHESYIVRHHAIWLFHRVMKFLQTTPSKFLLTSVPMDLFVTYGLSQQCCAHGETQDGLLGPMDMVSSRSIRYTFLQLLLLYIERVALRFTPNRRLAVLHALQFLVALHEIPYTIFFLLRCTCVGQATLALVKHERSSATHTRETPNPTLGDRDFIPQLHQDTQEEVLAIQALKLIKLVELHPIKQRVGVFCRRQTIDSVSTPKSFNPEQYQVASIPSQVFTCLNVPVSSSLTSKKSSVQDIECLGFQMLLEGLGDVNLHIARAAQHALLVLGAYEVVLTKPISCTISFSSLLTEEFLFSYLKNYFFILGDSTRKTAPHFLALSRVIHLFKETFRNTTIASRLIDVAFGLCNACDGLVKQLTESARSGSIGPHLMSPLALFSPSLSMHTVPMVAMGVLACFSGIHPSAFASRTLSRSCLRLVVGLLDFVDLKLFQAQYQMCLLASTSQEKQVQNDKTAQHKKLHCIKVEDMDSNDIHQEKVHFHSISLYDAFIDFCISYASTIVQIIWLCNETSLNSMDSSTQTKFGLPFMLGRGKTSAFILRGLQDPRAKPLRDAMATKTSLMSRILKERLDVQYPGFMFVAYCSSEIVSPEKQTKDKTSIDHSPLSLQQKFSSTADFYKEHQDFSVHHLTSSPCTLEESRLYEHYISWLSQDLAGNGTEHISMPSADIIAILLALHTFDSYFFWNDWVMHLWLSLRSSSFVESLTFPPHVSSIQTQNYSIFHFYPYVLDSQSVWTSTFSYPVIHSILDIWVVAAGLLFQETSKRSLLQSKADGSTSGPKMEALSTFSGSTQRRLAHYYQHYQSCAEKKLRPVTGLSWSGYSHIGHGGNLVSNDFHALFHLPLGVSLAHVLCHVLYFSFTYDAYKSRDTFLASCNPTVPFVCTAWVAVQTVIFQLKLLLALYIPLEFRVAQCYSFLNSFDSLSIALRLAPFVLRLFFRFVIFNEYLPPGFKSLIARFLVVPLLLHLCTKKQALDECLQKELNIYFREIVFCSPYEDLRHIEGFPNHQAASLSDLPDITKMFELIVSSCKSIQDLLTHDHMISLICYSTIHYFELFLNRFIPEPDSNEKNQRCSLNHLQHNEEFQLEILRVLRYVSELAVQCPIELQNIDPSSMLPFISNLCQSDFLVIRHWSYYYISCAVDSRPWMLGYRYPTSLTVPSMLVKFLVTLIECPQLETRLVTRNCLDRLIHSLLLSPKMLTWNFILPSFYFFHSCETSMPYIQVLQNVCQLVVRHRQYLYTMRDYLSLPCYVVLGRIAFNAGSDARRVILDVIHVLLSWELESRAEASRLLECHDTEDSHLYETCAYYAMKAGLTSVTDPPLVSRALSCFTRCFLLCPNITIRFYSILKSLIGHLSLPVDSHHLSAHLNEKNHAHRMYFIVIQLIYIILTFQAPELTYHSLGLIMQTLDPLWECLDVEIIHWLGLIVEHLIQHLPPPPVVYLSTLLSGEMTVEVSPVTLFWRRLTQIILCGLEKAVSLAPQPSCAEDLNPTLEKLIFHSKDSEGSTDFVHFSNPSLAAQYHMMNGLLNSLKHHSFYSYFSTSCSMSQKRLIPQGTFTVDAYLSCRLLYAFYARFPLSTEVARQMIFINFGTWIFHALHGLIVFLKEVQSSLASLDSSTPSHHRFLLSEHVGGSTVTILEHRYDLLVQLLKLTASFLFYETNHETPSQSPASEFASRVATEYSHYSALKLYMQKAFYILLLDIPEIITDWAVRNAVLNLSSFLLFGPQKHPAPHLFNLTPQTFPLPFTSKDFQTWDYLDLPHFIPATCLQVPLDTSSNLKDKIPIRTAWDQLTQHRLCLFDTPYDAKQKVFQSWTSSQFNVLHLSYLLHCWAGLWISRDANLHSQKLFFQTVLAVAHYTSFPITQDTSLPPSTYGNDRAWCLPPSSFSKSFFDLSHPEYNGSIGFWVSHIQQRLRYLGHPKKHSSPTDKTSMDFIQFQAPFLNLAYPLTLGALLSDAKIHKECFDVMRSHLPSDSFQLIMAFVNLPELERIQCPQVTGLFTQLLLRSSCFRVCLHPITMFSSSEYKENNPKSKKKISDPSRTTQPPRWFYDFQSLGWLAFYYTSVANNVLMCLIPPLWASLSSEAQMALTESLVTLLSYKLENSTYFEQPLTAAPPESHDPLSFFKKWRYFRFFENIPKRFLTSADLPQYSARFLSQHSDRYTLVQNLQQHFSADPYLPPPLSEADSKTFMHEPSSLHSSFYLRHLMHKKIHEGCIAPFGLNFLKILSYCIPRVIFPHELLQYIAQHSKCWHLVIQQLINQFIIAPQFFSLTTYGHAIINMCEAIQDRDTAHAITYLLSVCDETRNTLANVSLGQWFSSQQQFNSYMKQVHVKTQTDLKAAQHCLASLHISKKPLIVLPEMDVKKATQGIPESHNEMYHSLLSALGLDFAETLSFSSKERSESPQKQIPDDLLFIKTPLDLFLVSDGIRHEIKTWTRDWIRASTQLNQWNCLSEISSMTSVPLAQDAKCKLQDWTSIERLVTCYNISTPQAAIGYFYATLQKTANALPNYFSVTQSPRNALIPTLAPTGFSSTTPSTNQSSTLNDSSLNFSYSGSPNNISTQSVNGSSTPITLGGYLSSAASQQLQQQQPLFIPFLHQQIKIMHRFLVLCQQLIVTEMNHSPSIPGRAHLQSFLVSQLQVEATEGLCWVVEFLRRISSSQIFSTDSFGIGREAVANKALISTWRSRLLSNVDDIRSWSDLLVWRNCLFTVVQSLISFCPVLPQDQQALCATYQQDVAWTILKFAQIAHWPHGLPDVALALLSKLHTLHTFFTSPAYTADYLMMITRCVKLCQTKEERLAALNLLRGVDFNAQGQTPNSEHLQPLDKLKADIYLCKARLLADLPELRIPEHSLNYEIKTLPLERDVLSPEVSSDASLNKKSSISFWPKDIFEQIPHNIHHVFTELVSVLELCPTLSRAWATWGTVSDQIFSSKNILQNDTPSPKFNTPVDIEIGASAIIGYLVATYLSPSKGIRFLPRTLALLTYDNNEQILCSTFARFSDIVPNSLWLPWIPQLLSNLERREALPFYSILNRLLLSNPQDVYYSIRSFYMEQHLTVSYLPLSKNKTKEIFNLDFENQLKPFDVTPNAIDQSSSKSFVSTSVKKHSHSLNVSIHNEQSGDFRENFPAIRQQNASPYIFTTQKAKEFSGQLLVDVFLSTAAPLCIAMENLANVFTEISISIALDEIIRALYELRQQLLTLSVSQDTLPMSYSQFLHERIVLPCLDIFLPEIFNEDIENPALIYHRISNTCPKGLLHYDNHAEPTNFLYVQEMLQTWFPQFKKDFFSHLSLKNVGYSLNGSENTRASTLLKSMIHPTDWTFWGKDHCLKITNRWITLLSFYATHHFKLCFQQFIYSSYKHYCTELLNEISHSNVRLTIPGIHLCHLNSYSTIPRHSMAHTVVAKKKPFTPLMGFEIYELSFQRDDTQCRHLISMNCYNGTIYTFSTERSKTLFQQRSEQRNIYMLYHINQCLLSGKESRRRSLLFPIPNVIPIHPFVALVDITNQISLLDIRRQYPVNKSEKPFSFLERVYICKAQQAALQWKKVNISSLESYPEKEMSDEMIIKASQIAHADTMKLDSQQYLATYLFTSFPDPQRLALAQERLAADAALWCFLGFIYFTADPFTADALLYDKRACRLTLTPCLSNMVCPTYDLNSFLLKQKPLHAVSSSFETLTLEKSSTYYPPFRLTPNLLNMIGVVKRLGVMPNAILASLHAFALEANQTIFRTIFYIITRDDLYSRAVSQSIKHNITYASFSKCNASSNSSANFLPYDDSTLLFPWTPTSQFIQFGLSFSKLDECVRSTFASQTFPEGFAQTQTEKTIDSIHYKDLSKPTSSQQWKSSDNMNALMRQKARENTNLVLSRLLLLDYSIPSTASQNFNDSETNQQNTCASINGVNEINSKDVEGASNKIQQVVSSINDENFSLMRKILILLDAASCLNNHALMKPSWAPWF